MFIAFSFVGKLPSYIVECIHQTRLFFQGDIYLIINDLSSDYLSKIEKYNINIVNYEDVKHEDFDVLLQETYSKFFILHGLTGREELFIRSIERFFLLSNLMKKRNLSDCLFLELDNLIYDNPEKWINSFSKKELSYMIFNDTSASSGLMFIKNSNSLDTLLSYFIDYVKASNDRFITEMIALYRYMNDTIQIIPTYWEKNDIKMLENQNFGDYGDSIFDALGIGMYLLGMDIFHTNGKLEVGKKNPWGGIDYSLDIFEWKEENGLKIPYIYTGEKWLKINNLHVHSKDLKSGISKSMEE